MDVRAAIDQADSLGLRSKVNNQQVVVLGHSWGGTTVLQLAGLRPMAGQLLDRCDEVDDPNRNLSWTLQCSWLQGVNQAAITDRRVIAAAAVSPPSSLLFPRGAGLEMSGRVLVVSGSRDWVVPPDPEAIDPMRLAHRRGNQLVLVYGGDHFNLRPEEQPAAGLGRCGLRRRGGRPARPRRPAIAEEGSLGQHRDADGGRHGAPGTVNGGDRHGGMNHKVVRFKL
jgi:predicted dienelactone hydrolase